MDFADVILTTAHKSKGLEFTSVQVTDDFISEHLYPNNIQGLPPDEYNLLYVAVTRAKKTLHLSAMLRKILELSGVNFILTNNVQRCRLN
ncbi:hypothetical protein LSH36_612g00002 [Paralvinella palmiformis]|uniref:UvrD-like helicase C-terminal domain-containing protein n=1 Tax=Paralvinella palmiformis TaxID=53620 RepID=A0AAD9MX95_9ANNE|nr:hypothetical protein LSH36_612g00002 [Paralvinella palmiformis]